MQPRSVHLSYRIPGIGSEFTVGHNCKNIHLTAAGWLIEQPQTERQEPYSWDILAAGHGWCQVDRKLVPTCDVCGYVASNNAGLSSHVKRKHSGGNK